MVFLRNNTTFLGLGAITIFAYPSWGYFSVGSPSLRSRPGRAISGGNGACASGGCRIEKGEKISHGQGGSPLVLWFYF